MLVALALGGCAGGGSATAPVGSTPGGGTSTGGSATANVEARWIAPTGAVGDDVVIEYALLDPDSDTAGLTVEYSPDGGASWFPATPAAQHPQHEAGPYFSTSPLGARHAFVWDSRADLGAVNAIHVRLRLTPTEAAGAGKAATSDEIAVINLGRQDPDCDYAAAFGELVLSVDRSGGFVPASVARNHVVHTRIYGDGKVVYRTSADGDRVIYAGWLSERQICALFKLLAEKDFWNMKDSYRAQMAPTDLPSARVTAALRGGRRKSVSSYGGAISAPPGYMEIYDALHAPPLEPAQPQRYVRVPISSSDLQRGYYFGAEHEKKWDTPSNWIWVAGGGPSGADVWRQP
ncbi:MAG: hypothetical protein D6776_03985 [Planctomycetota bacterium]|nr:MAG: hypothetical protein D6776_03985 [Planctomycetota bacterium]